MRPEIVATALLELRQQIGGPVRAKDFQAVAEDGLWAGRKAFSRAVSD